MSICNQWQRYTISYAKGYNGEGEKHDQKFMITLAYPTFTDNYGLLAGPLFTVVFAIVGVFAGIISDNVNRTIFATGVCILWSLTTLGTGLIDSFTWLFVFRFLLGLFEGAYNPCAYGIISDYFHPNYRTTANAIYNGAIYLGGALASISAVLIATIGWRVTYDIIGIVGVVAGVCGLIFIREPKRGKFDKPKEVEVDERKQLLDEHESELEDKQKPV